MPSAFISHSSPDDRYVQEMVQYLRTLGYDDVFNDGHTIAPDELLWNRIEKGIRECDAFVVILSHASVTSYWVDREVRFARDLGKKVIPVRIDDCKLPPSFGGRDVIDLRQGRGDKVKLTPSRITKHSPKILFGRDHWLGALDAAWANPRMNVYTLVAWGGVGKTSLVAHWVSQRMAAKGWPGVERYFDWSFYSQGTGESRQTSSDLFIQEALKFFDDPDPTRGSPWERGERLAGLVRRHRTLLVLDGIEPLQYPLNDPQAGRLKDQALEALLQGLAADNPGLCVVTTREHLKNVENQATTEEQKLDTLVKDAAIALLRHLQIVGTEAEMEAAWKDAGGHVLTLQLLGQFLADAHGGDIRHYKEVKFEEADQERRGRSAFKVMIAYEALAAIGRAGAAARAALLAADRSLRSADLARLPASPACRAGDSRPDGRADEAERRAMEHRLEAARRSRSPDRDGGRHRRPSAGPRILRRAASRHSSPRRSAPRTRGCSITCARPRRIGPTPSPASSPSTRPSPTAASPGDSRRRAIRSISTASCAAQATMASTARRSSGRSARTWGRWRRSSRSRGAGWRRTSARRTRPGCSTRPPSACAPWDASPKPSSRCGR